jgi:hypothetical protein
LGGHAGWGMGIQCNQKPVFHVEDGPIAHSHRWVKETAL